VMHSLMSLYHSSASSKIPNSSSMMLLRLDFLFHYYLVLSEICVTSQRFTGLFWNVGDYLWDSRSFFDYLWNFISFKFLLNIYSVIFFCYVQSQLPGFYDPCMGEEKCLYVQYTFHGVQHEVTIQDAESLRIPKQCNVIFYFKSAV